MNIYLLPGLGADERLFQYLDLEEFNVKPIRWITPQKNESMAEYALRLATAMDSNPVLIGQSFGGIMAIELGKIMPTKKIVLISSAATYVELPVLYRFAGKLKLHKVMTAALLKRSHRMTNWIMGATDPLRRELLAAMLRDTDEHFLHWAVDKIVTWKNTTPLTNVYRIHGDNDRVLPFRTADYRIEGGTHLMVADRANEVTAAIKNILASGDR